MELILSATARPVSLYRSAFRFTLGRIVHPSTRRRAENSDILRSPQNKASGGGSDIPYQETAVLPGFDDPDGIANCFADTAVRGEQAPEKK
jgi:hypothetical protein